MSDLFPVVRNGFILIKVSHLYPFQFTSFTLSDSFLRGIAVGVQRFPLQAIHCEIGRIWRG